MIAQEEKGGYIIGVREAVGFVPSHIWYDNINGYLSNKVLLEAS